MTAKILLEIAPKIPEPLRRMPELAANLYFGWHRPTRAIFEDLAPELWRQTGGNPKLMLRTVAQSALERAAADPAYLERYGQALEAFDRYIGQGAALDAPLVAYFCAEYGFHESFPIYSGGLGVLAGDHCKAASDERLNFVAVGLLYGQGYFTQSVDSDGIQHAVYRDHDPRDQPVEPVHDADGNWLTVAVRIAARSVHARIWRARVGRVSVYLLDANCPENAAADRLITHRLYGGDDTTRIRQEMMLGIGGLRALRAVGLAPDVWHMNEGHAAFLILELLRERLAEGLDFDVALEAVAAQCAFTTHTPVAAGHDKFGHELFLQHFSDYLRESRLPLDRVAELGLAPGAPGLFNMTRLALAGARRVNGVSRIHGRVSRRLCAEQWPDIPPDDNPVGYVTNGVHIPTYLHQRWADYFDSELAADWRERLGDRALWQSLHGLPAAAYWRTSQDVKARMLSGVRERLRREFRAKGMSGAQWRHATRNLDPERPDVLTVGFARRFATYKRAALLLRDRARLARILHDPERPMLLLFAGKAHPADEPGKAVLREIKQLMLTPEFAGRVVFLDDYDIRLARWLVSGCDVWLNNPIAPLEASGTSGIKAAANGTLNLSVLDGWWAEACDGENGWGISPVDVQDGERRDALEAANILDTLEEEVLPLYYARDVDGVPEGWVQRCKHAMSTVIPQFNMRRVVVDYAEGLYYPAAQHGERLANDGSAGAHTLADFKRRARQAWPQVSMRREAEFASVVPHGEPLRLRVAVHTGGLAADELAVELIGRRRLPDTPREFPALTSYRAPLHDGLWRVLFAPTGEQAADGATVYALDTPSPDCGQYELAIRAYPAHPLSSHPYELGLMKQLE